MRLVFDDDGQPVSNDELDSSLTKALDVATRDIPSNADFLTTPAHQDDVVNLFTREWNDDGRAVSGLTDWIDPARRRSVALGLTAIDPIRSSRRRRRRQSSAR